MLATRTSRWTLGTALLCLALLAISWLLLVSPRRADATSVNDQAVQADAQAVQLQSQLGQLKAQFADLAKQKAQLAAIKTQLPPTADIPDLVRDLQSYAGQAGVSLDSIVPGTPALLAADGSVASAGSVAGPGSLVSIPLTMGATGDYFEVSLFTKYIQTRLTRSFLITGVTTSGGTTTTTPTATVTATPSPSPRATAASITLALTGSAFVLMDGTSTLAQVTKDAKAAAGSAKTTASPSAT